MPKRPHLFTLSCVANMTPQHTQKVKPLSQDFPIYLPFIYSELLTTRCAK